MGGLRGLPCPCPIATPLGQASRLSAKERASAVAKAAISESIDVLAWSLPRTSAEFKPAFSVGGMIDGLLGRSVVFDDRGPGRARGGRHQVRPAGLDHSR